MNHIFFCILFFYDALRKLIFNEMSVQNPEMLCWSDDERVEWFFNFNVYKLVNFVSKTLSGWLDSFIHSMSFYEVVVFISDYCDYVSL